MQTDRQLRSSYIYTIIKRHELENESTSHTYKPANNHPTSQGAEHYKIPAVQNALKRAYYPPQNIKQTAFAKFRSIVSEPWTHNVTKISEHATMDNQHSTASKCRVMV